MNQQRLRAGVAYVHDARPKPSRRGTVSPPQALSEAEETLRKIYMSERMPRFRDGKR